MLLSISNDYLTDFHVAREQTACWSRRLLSVAAQSGPSKWQQTSISLSNPSEFIFRIVLQASAVVLSCGCAVTHNNDLQEFIMSKPTIDQLEAILANEEEVPIEILPNGEVRAKGQTSSAELGGKKPLTMRENLGGEYGEGAL
jgi:hypothetical protein